LLVRPLHERGFEIVAGARRYRAAQMAQSATVPVRIVNLTDAEALEAQLVELSIVVKRFSLSSCGPVRPLYVNDVLGRGLTRHALAPLGTGRTCRPVLKDFPTCQGTPSLLLVSIVYR
jgi:hypothetical protein